MVLVPCSVLRHHEHCVRVYLGVVLPSRLKYWTKLWVWKFTKNVTCFTCMYSSCRDVLSWGKNATAWICHYTLWANTILTDINLVVSMLITKLSNFKFFGYMVCTSLLILPCHFGLVYKQMWLTKQKILHPAQVNSNVAILTITSRHFLIVGTIYCNSQHCTYMYLHIQEEDITSNKTHGSAFKTNFQYLLSF